MKLYLQTVYKTIKEIYNERDWKDCNIVSSHVWVMCGRRIADFLPFLSIF